MFVRKKTNRSGTISIVVVSKAHGKFTEVKKYGVAKSEEEADEMFREAQLCRQNHHDHQGKVTREWYFLHENPILDRETPHGQATFRPI